MTCQIEFVYFDLDDTLLDHRSAERAALADLAGFVWGKHAAEHAPALQAAYGERNRALWHDYADGVIGRDQLRELRFKHVVDSFEVADKSWKELDQFYMNRYRRHWAAIDGAREAFEEIASRIGVGIITNGFAEVQHAKLARFPFIEEWSRALIISEEVGFLKPDGRLFANAESAAGVPGSRILYVGDSYRSDVLGALGAGWMAAWFTAAAAERLPDRSFSFERWTDLVRRVFERV